MIVTTPKEITEQIASFCADVSPQQHPLFLNVRPYFDALALECFENVKNKIQKDDGSLQHGWRIWEWPGVMVEAEFHAVWKSPTGDLIDITPSKDERILFLPDDSRTYAGVTPNNMRKALSSDSDIQEFVKLTDNIYELIVKQKENPTRDNYLFVGLLLEQMAPRQEFLADEIAKRHPFPDGRPRARIG